MTDLEFKALKDRLRQETMIALAAGVLADHRWREKPIPKRDRIWTGVFRGRRAYRDQKVILPDGNVGVIFGIQRGMAAVRRWDARLLLGCAVYVLPVAQLEPFRLPGAVMLGKRKAGCKEQPSEKKCASCRKNGAAPCREGKRRGRPRRDANQPAQV